MKLSILFKFIAIFLLVNSIYGSDLDSAIAEVYSNPNPVPPLPGPPVRLEVLPELKTSAPSMSLFMKNLRPFLHINDKLVSKFEPSLSLIDDALESGEITAIPDGVYSAVNIDK